MCSELTLTTSCDFNLVSNLSHYLQVIQPLISTSVLRQSLGSFCSGFHDVYSGLLSRYRNSHDSAGLCCVPVFRSRTRGPIGPGKYGYGKAPYILPLQTDTMHTPQRLRRQRPSSRHSRSQEASASRQGYRPPAHQFSHSGPLYLSDSGPRSGLLASEASIYQLPLTHEQSYPAAPGLYHSPELSSNGGARPQGSAQAFPQHLRSTAISCIGAYRQYKLCNTDVSTQTSVWACRQLFFLISGQLTPSTWKIEGAQSPLSFLSMYLPICVACVFVCMYIKLML